MTELWNSLCPWSGLQRNHALDVVLVGFNALDVTTPFVVLTMWMSFNSVLPSRCTHFCLNLLAVPLFSTHAMMVSPMWHTCRAPLRLLQAVLPSLPWWNLVRLQEL